MDDCLPDSRNPSTFYKMFKVHLETVSRARSLAFTNDDVVVIRANTVRSTYFSVQRVLAFCLLFFMLYQLGLIDGLLAFFGYRRG